MRRLVRWLPLLYTLGLSGFLLFGPAYTSVTTSSSPTGTAVAETTKTLLDVTGAGVLPILAIPVLIAAVPLVAQRSRQRSKVTLTATVLMLGFALVSGFSIGLFYLPAVIALALATDAAGKTTADDAASVTAPPPR